jgi:hypothetical protein
MVTLKGHDNAEGGGHNYLQNFDVFKKAMDAALG